MNTMESMKSKYAKVSMLGGFSITVDGATISDQVNRTHKLWNILSYILMHRDRMVSQAEFIKQFWPDESGAAPVNALKTQLYRIRTTLEPLFGDTFQPIVSHRGGYQWNPAIETELDVDLLEESMKQLSQIEPSSAEREDLLQEVIDLYRGAFLPKLNNSKWVTERGETYHKLFLQAVIEYAELIERRSKYADMVELMERAVAIHPLDEKLHTFLIRGLLHQGKHTAALAHYEYATDLLYRNMGVQQWKELRELYDQLMATEQVFETDLTVIQQDLRETAQKSGAFFCEYGSFREIYRLEARRCKRSGLCIHIVLITVSNQDGSIPVLKPLNKTMEQLQEVVAQYLRSGDVVSRYSSAQFIVMLPGATLEDSERVVARILSQFRRRHRMNRLKISPRIREIEMS